MEQSSSLPSIPEPGFYYHYKHDPTGPINEYAYEMVGLGKHTEDDTYVMLYRPLYINEWQAPATYSVRPLDMFGDVTKDGKTFPRFSRITDPEVIAQLEGKKREMYGD